MSFLDKVRKVVSYTSPGTTQLWNFADGKGDKGKHTARNFLDPNQRFSKEHYAKEDAKHAEAAAAQSEAEKQAAIKKGIADVNATFDSPTRQAGYDQFAAALRANYQQDANRQKTIADRNTKFAMAGAGLTGGSAERDARRTLGEEYTRGILQSENKTQDAVANLRGRDEQARMNLIQLVTGGLDATTALGRANAQIASNLEGQRAAGMMQGVGDVFTNTAAAYKKQNDAAQFRRGLYTPVGSPYGTPPGGP